MKSFSTEDYYRMWKARGIRFPIQYFLQNHLFDLINKTDTHSRLEKNEYKSQPEGFDEGILYMSCLTNELKKSLKIVKRELLDRIYDYQFLDLGSGKGKSLLIYSNFFGEKSKFEAIGIEYYGSLTI